MTNTLVALTPQEVAPAQANLVDWCWQKMRSLGQEYADLRANLVLAEKHQWKTSGLKAAVNRTRKRIHYYMRIRAAVKAGYLVIPNFDIDVLAVRVSGAKPRWRAADYDRYSVTHVEPDLLPPGEGRYVSELAETHDGRWQAPAPTANNPKATKTVGSISRIGYIEDIDLPLVALKPQVVDATANALRRRIFDRIGIVKGHKKADPIMVGQIIDPTGGDRMFRPKVVSFFIAWWLDPETL